MSNKEKWVLSFGLWSGAWVFVNFLSSISVNFLMSLVPTYLEASTVLNISNNVGFCSSLVVAITALFFRDNLRFLLISYLIWAVVFEIVSNFSTLVFYLDCERNCGEIDAYFPVSNYIAFLKQVIGYFIGTILLAFLTNSTGLLASFRTSIIVWLEIDVQKVNLFWVKWASLPLWASGSWLKRHISDFAVAMCVWGAFISVLGFVNSAVITPVYFILTPETGFVPINDLTTMIQRAVLIYGGYIIAAILLAPRVILWSSALGFRAKVILVFIAGAMEYDLSIYQAITSLITSFANETMVDWLNTWPLIFFWWLTPAVFLSLSLLSHYRQNAEI